MSMSQASNVPRSADDLTTELLTALVQQQYPDVVVEEFAVTRVSAYGEAMVSTAARVALELRYGGAAAPGLPAAVVVKIARDDSELMAPFYANEVNFYNRLRPELAIEAPRALGGAFDPQSKHFALLLEDLTRRGARFTNVTQRIDITEVRSLLDTLAVLHARFWESPRFETDLSWVQTHVQGELAQLQNEAATPLIQHEIDHEQFKREMVERLRTTGCELRAGMIAMQRHQASLPQTLLHGDTHLGNCYLLADGSAGLLDWQLMVRGYCMHDVSYLVSTALSVAVRREHEQALLRHYLERLAELGVANPPSFDDAWLEFRRSLVWGVYYGWLTTPVVNYGWQINVMNHFRLTTAFEDHQTGRLVRELSH